MTKSSGSDKSSNPFADFVNGTTFDKDSEAFLTANSTQQAQQSPQAATTDKKEVPREEPKPIAKTCTGSDFDANVRRMSANEVTEDEVNKFNSHCDTCSVCGARRMKLLGNLRTKPNSY